MRRGLAIMVLTGVLGLAASSAAVAGGGLLGQPCAGFGEGDVVVLRDGCLDAVAHVLPAGADLEVRNDGQMTHDYVAVDDSFSTGPLAPGASAVLTGVDPGVHRVVCTLHSAVTSTGAGEGMTGLLVVEEAEVAAADAQPVAVAVISPATISGRVILALIALCGVLAVAAIVLARRRGVVRG